MNRNKNVTAGQLQDFAVRVDERLDDLEEAGGGVVVHNGVTIGAIEASGGTMVIITNCTVTGTLTSKVGSRISVATSTLKGSPAVVANGGIVHLCGGNIINSTVDLVECNGGKIIV